MNQIKFMIRNKNIMKKLKKIKFKIFRIIN